MLTRDTCRSVDFTAWRVCPYTHTYTSTFSKESRLHTCSIRVPGATRTHGGRSESGRGEACYTRVCTSLARREPLSGQRVHIRAFIYGYIWPGGWVTAWLHWVAREVARNWEKLIVLRQMAGDWVFRDEFHFDHRNRVITIYLATIIKDFR